MANRAEMMEELKPCPFCGMTPGFDFNIHRRWAICCVNTSCTRSFFDGTDRDEVLRRWNTRASQDTGGGEREAVMMRMWSNIVNQDGEAVLRYEGFCSIFDDILSPASRSPEAERATPSTKKGDDNAIE